MRVHTFPKDICPKVNEISRLEYELAYYDSAVHRFNHYTKTTPPLMAYVMYYISDHQPPTSYIDNLSSSAFVLTDRKRSKTDLDLKLDKKVNLGILIVGFQTNEQSKRLWSAYLMIKSYSRCVYIGVGWMGHDVGL